MIAIIKYNAGNISSVENAVKRLGYDCIVTDDRATILKADKVIFPGVGAAKSAMSYLKSTGLDKTILSVKKPFLGICLGLQLMCRSTEEGQVKCLGIFDVDVRLFPPLAQVPHMGWNNLTMAKGDLFEGVERNEDVYFVHSYYAPLCFDAVAAAEYILPFSAAMQKQQYYATQFHPEKSAEIGEIILKNFLEL